MLTRERSAPANLTLTIVAHKEPQATGSERTLRIVRERAGMGGIVYGGSRAYRTVILVLWACSPSTRIIRARLCYRHPSSAKLIGACWLRNKPESVCSPWRDERNGGAHARCRVHGDDSGWCGTGACGERLATRPTTALGDRRSQRPALIPGWLRARSAGYKPPHACTQATRLPRRTRIRVAVCLRWMRVGAPGG